MSFTSYHNREKISTPVSFEENCGVYPRSFWVKIPTKGERFAFINEQVHKITRTGGFLKKELLTNAFLWCKMSRYAV